MNPKILVFLLHSTALCYQAHATASCLELRQECLRLGKCEILPIPESALSPPISPDGFNVTQIRPGVFAFTEGSYYSLILFANRVLTMIDFPFTPTLFDKEGAYILNKAVSKILSGRYPKIIHMVYGHRHLDHIGGATAFFRYGSKAFPAVPIRVWGSDETTHFLGRNAGSQIPKITRHIRRQDRFITLNPNLKVKLSIIGGHTASDLLVHILRSRDWGGVVHLADVLTPGYVQFISFGETVDFGRYIMVLDELLQIDFETFSAGHGRLGTKLDIRVSIEYARDVRKAMDEAHEEVVKEGFLSQLYARYSDPTRLEYDNAAWLVKTTLDEHVRRCEKKLVQKYGCRLAGTEIFAASHCEVVYTYINVDVE